MYYKGFRPWFPNGFVYYPTCQKPLRHNEIYALDKRQGVEIDLTKKEKVCPQCGKVIGTDANFCPHCGGKC